MEYKAWCSSYRTYTKSPPTRTSWGPWRDTGHFLLPKASLVYFHRARGAVQVSALTLLQHWHGEVTMCLPLLSPGSLLKSKQPFAKHVFEIHQYSAYKVSVKRMISFLCSLVPHAWLLFFSAGPYQNLTYQPKRPAGRSRNTFNSFFSMSFNVSYKKAQFYKPTSAGSSTCCPPKEKGRRINYQDMTGREPSYSYLRRSEPTGSLLIPLVDHRASLTSK